MVNFIPQQEVTPMLLVRNMFVAKPGCGSKLAAHLKESAAALQLPNARVWTDVTGDFNRVVMEFTAGSLAEIEQIMKMIGTPAYRENMAGYTDLWLTGSREILREV
jgi:hypothetical protein